MGISLIDFYRRICANYSCNGWFMTVFKYHLLQVHKTKLGRGKHNQKGRNSQIVLNCWLPKRSCLMMVFIEHKARH